MSQQIAGLEAKLSAMKAFKAEHGGNLAPGALEQLNKELEEVEEELAAVRKRYESIAELLAEYQLKTEALAAAPELFGYRPPVC